MYPGLIQLLQSPLHLPNNKKNDVNEINQKRRQEAVNEWLPA